MRQTRSFTSRLRVLAAALAAGGLLAACGGAEDPAASGMSGSRSLAATTVAAASEAVAPGSIRVHFRRVQNDTAEWGVYSWDGPQHPSTAWISTRFMFARTDGFGGYVDIPLAAGKSALWFLVTDGNGTKNKVARINNARYKTYFQKITKPNNRQNRTGTLS